MGLIDVNGNQIELGGSASPFSEYPEKYEKLVSLKDMQTFGGYISGSTYMYPNSTSYRIVAVPCNGGDKVIAESNGASGGRIAILKSFEKPTTEGQALNFATGETSYHTMFQASQGLVCPSDARYVVVQVKNNNNDTTPISLVVGGRKYTLDVREEIYDDIYNTGVNWLSFGDSIATAYYSYYDDNGVGQTVGASPEFVYPTLIAKKKHWNMTNRGASGCGWMYSPTASKTGLAYNRVRDSVWDGVNLATFAYGINDFGVYRKEELGSLEDEYAYSDDMTPRNVVECMRFCFDYIAKHNPCTKIIVMLPLNEKLKGTYETNWARGFVNNVTQMTLDEYSDLLKSVCDHYGIETIDLTRESCVNTMNITELMPDGIHPSKECHELLAREIATKIHMS